MIITTSSTGGGSNSSKHGPTLSASVLGFLGLSLVYPGGAQAFLGNTLNLSRAAKLTRVASITCIFGLATNLLEEYRTHKNYFTGEDDSHSLIHHHKPARVDDLWNPVTGAFIAGAALQARQRSLMRILKGGGYFSVGMGLYSIGLDLLEPYYPIKNLDLFQSASSLLDLANPGATRK